MYRYFVIFILALCSWNAFAGPFEDLEKKLTSSELSDRQQAVKNLGLLAGYQKAFDILLLFQRSLRTEQNADLRKAILENQKKIVVAHPEFLAAATKKLETYFNKTVWHKSSDESVDLRGVIGQLAATHPGRIDRAAHASLLAEIAYSIALYRARTELSPAIDDKLFYRAAHYFAYAAAKIKLATSIRTFHFIFLHLTELLQHKPQLNSGKMIEVGMVLMMIEPMVTTCSLKGFKKSRLQKIYYLLQTAHLLVSQGWIDDGDVLRGAVNDQVSTIARFLRESKPRNDMGESKEEFLEYAAKFDVLLRDESVDPLAQDADVMERWLEDFDEKDKSAIELFDAIFGGRDLGETTDRFVNRPPEVLAHHIERLRAINPLNAARVERLILSIRQFRPDKVSGLVEHSSYCRMVWETNATPGSDDKK